jgi:parvulin-like peptidyl-prolyl isomerase
MKEFFKINDQAITADNIISLLYQYQMLPQLIREIIIDQQIKEVEISPQETVLCQKQFMEKYRFNHDQLQEWLQKNNLTMTEFEAIVIKPLKIEKLKIEKFKNTLESYFLKRKPQLDQVAYSLIRLNDQNLAKELYFRIEENEQTFEEVAKQYSQGAEANTGGFIDLTPLTVPHPQIAEILSTAKVGQLIPPIFINKWWVILRLEQKISAQLNEKIKQQLLNEQYEIWLQSLVDEQLAMIGY